MRIVFAIDISKSMCTKDIHILDSSFIDFFKMSLETSHEKFLSKLNSIELGSKISRIFATNIVLQAIKEFFSNAPLSVSIVWFNHKSGHLKFQGARSFVSFSKNVRENKIIKKVLSLAIAELSKSCFGASNLFLGLHEAKKLIDKTERYSIVVLSDGLWNCGISPIKFAYDEKLSISTISFGSNIPENLFMETLAKITKGLTLRITKIDKSLLTRLESWTYTLIDEG
ncbi:MAG: hypothetical protein ACP6IS_03620 [Candidatus Asgardarchaeia archaeon]